MAPISGKPEIGGAPFPFLKGQEKGRPACPRRKQQGRRSYARDPEKWEPVFGKVTGKEKGCLKN